MFQPPASVAQEVIEPSAAATLARGWSSFFDSEPFSAATAIEKLARSTNPGTKFHALHIEARNLWLAGDPVSRKSAQGTWTELAREGQGDPHSKARTDIARGLGFSSTGESAKAMDTIEQLTKQTLPSCVAIEAAIELALLYAEAGCLADAKARLDEADKILGYPESIGLPVDLQKAFTKGVKQARESIAVKGRALFELARGMQREKQFPRAIDFFHQVTTEFPAWDYAPRSQFEVGSCLVSMGKQDEAVEYWRAFVADAPAGPWRGQAFSRLIDIQLGDKLDLAEAERYALQAKAALSTALGQNLGASTGGWSEAAYGLHLRIGMIAFCEEDYAASCEALEQARVAAPDKAAADRLVSLVALAQEKRGIIPDDCRLPVVSRATAERTGDDTKRVALALTLGMLHHVAGLADGATGYFGRVTGSPAVPAAKGVPATRAVQPLPGATPAQLAFGVFGKGVLLEAAKQNKTARDAFLASLKISKGSPWHDETLCRVATIIEAEVKAPAPTNGDAGRDQVAAARSARAKALPFWREIVEKFPESPRREFAMYGVGVLMYGNAETASAAAGSKDDAGGIAEARKRVEKAWSDAAKALGAFTEAYPESEYAGDAYVRQIDLALERLFDLERAGTLGPLAAKWAKEGQRVPKAIQLAPWARACPLPSDAVAAATRRDCLMLAGLTAYLAERYDEAIDCINAAGPQAPQVGFTARPDLHAIGLDYLRRAIANRKPVSDARALEAATNDQQRMALQLGDLYLESIRPDRAEAVFRRVIEKEPCLGKVPAAIEAYAMIQIAVALDRIRDRLAEALEQLSTLVARRDLEGSYWHGLGMFRLALFTFNQKHDAHSAIPLYQAMLQRYPDHDVAELAMAYLCLCAIRIKDAPLARQIAKDFSVSYPHSDLIPVIEKRISTRLHDNP